MNYISILEMHQELSLIAILIIVFVMDLFLPESKRGAMHTTTAVLLTLQLLANIVHDEVTLFGGMYHSTAMASAIKSILTLGTILVVMQSTRWLNRADTKHKIGEFYI